MRTFFHFLFIFFFLTNLLADSTKNTEYDEVEAQKYAKISLKGEGTLYLSFRDFEYLINKNEACHLLYPNLQAIDYGCGAGRSTRYLKDIGIKNVDGFDISQEMIEQAKLFDPQGHYEVIESATILQNNDTYDLALLSFVVLAIDDKEEISRIFKELSRVVKPGGQILCLTLSEAFWNPERNWVIYKQDYPENYAPVSGQKSRLLITSIGLELTDTFWFEQDIIECAKKAGLSHAETYYPLGKESDGIIWQDELIYPPYTIFCFNKK